MPTRRLARSNDGDERRRRACVPAPRRHRRTATPAREATTVRLPKSPRSRRVEARARRSGKRFPTAATTDPTTASGLRRRHRRSAATMRRLAKTACFRGCGVERIDRARLGPLPRRARQGSRHAGLDRAAASRRKRHRRPTTRGSRRASGVLFTSSPRVALGRRVGARCRRRSGSRRRDRVPANRRRTRRHRRRRDVDRHRNASADLRFAVGSTPPRRSTSTARRPRTGRRGEAGVERTRRHRAAQNENGERRAGCRDRGPVLRSPLPPPSGRRCRIGWDQWSSSSSSSA